MGKRAARKSADRLLWAGLMILLLTAGMGVYASAGEDPVVLRVALAAFGLVAGMLLLLLRSHLLAAERAVEVLAESVRFRVTETPDLRTPKTVARRDSSGTPDPLPEEGVEPDLSSFHMEERLRQISSGHRDLLVHHRYTKRMLQSLRHEEILEILLEGVRDGLGFPGAILGTRDTGGTLFFRNDTPQAGGESLKIASWEEKSLVARTFWSGASLLVPFLQRHEHTEEDRLLVGEGVSFLVPVYKKSNRKCSDLKNCTHLDCPVYGVEGPRCWIEGRPATSSGDPEAPEQRRRECAQCEMFAPCGILVVREQPGSRMIDKDTIRVIAGLVDEAALALQVAELYENARIMSVTDGLTGLTNHREFYLSLRRELERARRYCHAVSLLMIDVDNFKEFNDLHGHIEGDRALRTIADILKRCVRASDIAARYGGEEFGIILPEATPVGAQMLAERIKTEIGSRNFLENGNGKAHLTVSIGIYTSIEGADTEDLMVGFADEAAYLAKNSGKNQVVVKAHA